MKPGSSGRLNGGRINEAKPTLIDLFCGIGGLGLGAVRSGFDLSLSVDHDPKLIAIHKENFPGFEHLNADIATLTGRELLDAGDIKPGTLTALIGGPPCQGFSRIGKRKLDDARNSLFMHFFRLVSETRPSFFLAENVEGILDEKNQALVARGLSLVPKSYRVLNPFVLNAVDFGAATIRRRVFFLGYAPDEVAEVSTKDFEARKWKAPTSVDTALTGLPLKLGEKWLTDDQGWRTVRSKGQGEFWDRIYSNRPEGTGEPRSVRILDEEGRVSGCVATLHSAKVRKRFNGISEGGVDRVSRMPRLKRTEQCPTLRAGTGPKNGSFQALRPIHFSEPRVITPREAARLQGFPDWYYFGRTKWHAFRGIGNSVSPFVSEAILSVLAEKLKRAP